MASSAAPRSLGTWDDVRLFLALSRARTVADAARALGVDASTVSRRLAALEESLAATLFSRSRDGITPTQAAEDLLAVAEEIEQGIARFANEVDRLEREVAGLVRITCPPIVAEVVVAPVVGALLAAHPQLRIALNPSEHLIDLTRREADIALRAVRPTRGDLVVLKVAEVQWVAAASADLVAASGKVGAWREVPWVGCDERSPAALRAIEDRLGGIEPRVCSDSILTRIALAHEGIGAVFLPEPSVSHYGLVALDLAPALANVVAEAPRDELFAVTHRALRDVPRVRVVWDALVARVRALDRSALRAAG